MWMHFFGIFSRLCPQPGEAGPNEQSDPDEPFEKQASSWLMQSLLFGVAANDIATYAAVSALLTLVAFAACCIPARRAMSVDPVVALRYE